MTHGRHAAWCAGLAFPSSAMLHRETTVADSPLWPTVDGDSDHQATFEDSSIKRVSTPCSRNSTRLNVSLLKKARWVGCRRAMARELGWGLLFGSCLGRHPLHGMAG